MSDQTSSVGDTKAIVGDESDKTKTEDKGFLALKEEKKALAIKFQEAQSELERLKNEAKTKEEEVLKQQGEYKKLYEDEQKSKLELAEKLKLKEKKELALRKVDVVMKELGVPLAKPEYWDFVDLDRIPVDEATKEIDINIAKQVANDFIVKFPELLVKKAGKVDNSAAATTSTLSYEEWVKLPIAEKRTRFKDVKK